MRHFYKLPINVQNVSLMVEIMQRQTELLDDKGFCKTLPPDARKVALGILQVTNGAALFNADLARVEHDRKLLLTPCPTGHARYIVVLSGQVMCLVNDECPAFNSAETWWIDSKSDAVIVNKSGDDAIIMDITIAT